MLIYLSITKGRGRRNHIVAPLLLCRVKTAYLYKFLKKWIKMWHILSTQPTFPYLVKTQPHILCCVELACHQQEEVCWRSRWPSNYIHWPSSGLLVAMLACLLKLSGVLELWWLYILPCPALPFVAPHFEDLCLMSDCLHNWVFAILPVAVHG